jgi:hypothetical protein
MLVNVMDVPSIPEFRALSSQGVSIAPQASRLVGGGLPDLFSQSINMAKR